MSGKALEKFLINFVVEQTGYPEEVVELDADLEADLGIDSIKKAQMFGELGGVLRRSRHRQPDARRLPDAASRRELPGRRAAERCGRTAAARRSGSSAERLRSRSPRTGAKRRPLRRRRSLRSVKSAGTRCGSTALRRCTCSSRQHPLAAASRQLRRCAALAALSGRHLEKFLINFVVEQTGYPPEVVELDADLEADLGIDSIKKAQLFGELARVLRRARRPKT